VTPTALIWQDLEGLESVNKALSPLQDFRDDLSGYMSKSWVKSVLHLLNTSVLAEKEKDLIKSLKSKILKYLNKENEGILLNMFCFTVNILKGGPGMRRGDGLQANWSGYFSLLSPKSTLTLQGWPAMPLVEWQI